MTLSELRDAAFWEHRVCLECTASFDRALGRECPVCGGEETTPADKLLSLLETLVEERCNASN